MPFSRSLTPKATHLHRVDEGGGQHTPGILLSLSTTIAVPLYCAQISFGTGIPTVSVVRRSR